MSFDDEKYFIEKFASKETQLLVAKSILDAQGFKEDSWDKKSNTYKMTDFEAAKKACGKNDIDESWVAIISNFNSSYWNDAQDWANDIQIKNAKEIISQIKSLYYSHKDGYQPTGYGNSELNEAINAMENYIKEIKSNLKFAGSIGLR